MFVLTWVPCLLYFTVSLQVESPRSCLHHVSKLQVGEPCRHDVKVKAGQGKHHLPYQQVPHLSKVQKARALNQGCLTLLYRCKPNAYDRIPACYLAKQVKLQKGLVVFETDAVVGPHTVVVHQQHTSIANTAVVRPQRLQRITLLADALRTAPQYFFNHRQVFSPHAAVLPQLC